MVIRENTQQKQWKFLSRPKPNEEKDVKINNTKPSNNPNHTTMI